MPVVGPDNAGHLKSRQLMCMSIKLFASVVANRDRPVGPVPRNKGQLELLSNMAGLVVRLPAQRRLVQ